MDKKLWIILQIAIICSAQVTKQPEIQVNQQTPLFLQGSLPSDLNRNIYPSEIERMSFFDAEILDEVCDKTEGNVVISPASIKSVMGLLLNGATGKSAAEIQQTLRLPENQDSAKEQIQYVHNTLKNASSPGVTLKSANALFVAKDLRLADGYRQTAMSEYQAHAHSVDFRYPQTAVRTINNWVNQTTNGAIPAIVKAGTLKPESSLVIVNAIYFKANWLTRFEASETSVRPFHKTANQIMYTPMMHTTSFLKHSYVPALQAQVVQIPYQDNKHHMVIVLPKKKDGIHEVSRDLKHNTLLKVLPQQQPSEVILQLPRFTIEFDTDIVPALQDVKAGLVPLSTPQQVTFTADHPFLFFIYNSQTGVFLFEGRVSHPEESTQAQYEQSLKKADNKNTVIDRTKPTQQNNQFSTNQNQFPTTNPTQFPPARLPATNQNPARLPTNQNVPNVLQSEPGTQQPSIVVTQRSTSNNPTVNSFNHQLTPQKNVVVTQQSSNGLPQTTNFQTTKKESHVYTQPGHIPGTSQQIFYSSSSSSASSSHVSTSSESKNTHTSSFSFTRFPNGVNGPYQTTDGSDMHAIRFQL